MSFPRAPPSAFKTETERSDKITLSPILDPENREKREMAAKVLESWEYQAMHALHSGESIADVKLRMMKAMAETMPKNQVSK